MIDHTSYIIRKHTVWIKNIHIRVLIQCDKCKRFSRWIPTGIHNQTNNNRRRRLINKVLSGNNANIDIAAFEEYIKAFEFLRHNWKHRPHERKKGISHTNSSIVNTHDGSFYCLTSYKCNAYTYGSAWAILRIANKKLCSTWIKTMGSHRNHNDTCTMCSRRESDKVEKDIDINVERRVTSATHMLLGLHEYEWICIWNVLFSCSLCWCKQSVLCENNGYATVQPSFVAKYPGSRWV